MPRDWSEVKENLRQRGYAIDTTSLLLEAIAEIEQLRQEKAELVETLRNLIAPLDELGWWCPVCKEEVSCLFVTYNEYHETCGAYLGDCQPVDEVKELFAKLEGGDQK